VIPPFGIEFLAWLRDRTEAAWSRATTPTLAAFERARVGGAGWQRGTRWTGGFTDAEIELAEQKHRVVFPPDLRLFLGTLGATDRPLVGAGFSGDALVGRKSPGFYDWRRDEDAIRAARDGVVDGLLFDVEHNGLWLAAWGNRPGAERDRADVVRAAVAAAPPLLPLTGHRFLVGAPAVAGNPVLSVVQSDIIVYGGDLREFLVAELAELLAGEDADVGLKSGAFQRVAALPLWGELTS
jgi:hypothetical protein